MRVYRIEREKYLKTPLEGTGAAKTEGYRWNSLNTFIVYTASSRALATMEVAVHLDLNEDLPTDRFYVEIDIPEGVEILELEVNDLPKKWDNEPPVLETQFIGDSFVISNEFPVLRVPSSIVPPEYNYLINSNHKDASKIKVISKEPMQFDKRIKPKFI